MASSARVEQIVSLIAQLTDEERIELVERLRHDDRADARLTAVADAVERVVRDHPDLLAALAK